MREHLRWFKLWLVMGWLLVAAVIYLSLTPHPIEINVNHGDKIGHTLAYFGMMFWFAQLYRRRSHVWWGAGFIALGVSLEYVQGWSGYRDFEYLDMVADASGVAAAWLLAGTAAARVLNGLERLMRA